MDNIVREMAINLQCTFSYELIDVPPLASLEFESEAEIGQMGAFFKGLDPFVTSERGHEAFGPWKIMGSKANEDDSISLDQLTCTDHGKVT